MKKHHEEQLEDEIFMGYVYEKQAYKSSWITSRYGAVVRRDGRPDMPWFIKVSEVEQAIESARLADRPWSNETIKALQPMVDQRTAFAV